MSMTMSQVQRPYSLSQNKFYAHQTNVSPNKWFRTGNEGSNSYFEEFKVNSLALQRERTIEGSGKRYYDNQNPPWVNRNMSKT